MERPPTRKGSLLLVAILLATFTAIAGAIIFCSDQAVFMIGKRRVIGQAVIIGPPHEHWDVCRTGTYYMRQHPIDAETWTFILVASAPTYDEWSRTPEAKKCKDWYQGYRDHLEPILKTALASHTMTIPSAQALPALEKTDRPEPRQPWFWEKSVDMFDCIQGDERYFTIDLASGTFNQVKRANFPR